MKNTRVAGFVLFILIGIILGLIYGWVIKPAGVQNTTLSSLRADYKADYVLMVSEVYASDFDLDTATKLLKQVSPRDPIQAVQDALLVGQQFGYSEPEMRSLANLEMSLTGTSAVSTQGAP